MTSPTLTVAEALAASGWAIIKPSLEDYHDADQLVAHHLATWGWGQVEDLDGLAEHALAVDACAVGLAYSRSLAARATGWVK